MTSSEITELLDETKCLSCYGASLSDMIKIGLLSRIADGGGGGGDGVPSGVILMWSGTVATIPSGWVLCNGGNGTPDLRNRFVVAAQQDDAGQAKTNLTGSLTVSGGSVSHTHGITDPGHWHLSSSSGPDPYGAPGSVFVVADDNPTDTRTTGITVNSESAPQPYYALAFIMKT